MEVEKSNEVKLPSGQAVCYKGTRYIVKHTYQNSGEDLMSVLKKQLLKNLETLDITGIRCYNKDVNIFG